MRRHLIDALGADLIIHAQHTPEYNIAECAARYGEAEDTRVYENPAPDFSRIFDALRAELKYEFDWRDMFKQIKSANYHLGFDGPGTCIRRMYNRHLIHRQLQELQADYDWYILTRSDMFFLDDFPMHQCTNPNTLYSAAVGCWRGINNNLLVFGAPLREKVLNYITLFLEGSMARIGNPITPREGMGEEEFCKRGMDLQQVNQATINHNWFISADSEDELRTWESTSIHRHANGQLYKYKEEFESAYRNAGLPL